MNLHSPLTEGQRLTLKNIAANLRAAANGLDELQQSANKFNGLLPIAQNRAATLLQLARPDSNDRDLLDLLAAERRVTICIEFLRQSKPQITSKQLEILGTLREFEQIYEQIFPGSIMVTDTKLPDFAKQGAGESARANFAIAEIENLLAEK